jgi:hypothetical protein
MCFGLEWLESLIIWVIVICAVVAFLKLLGTFLLPRLGLNADILALVVRAITIFIWAIVCIAVVIFIFDLIACLLPMARVR